MEFILMVICVSGFILGVLWLALGIAAKSSVVALIGAAMLGLGWWLYASDIITPMSRAYSVVRSVDVDVYDHHQRTYLTTDDDRRIECPLGNTECEQAAPGDGILYNFKGDTTEFDQIYP